MKKKNISWKIFVLLLVIASIIVAGCSTGGNNVSGQTTSGNDFKDIQEVHVKIVGANYVFEPTTLKKGAIVKLIFDMTSVDGCARTVVIPSFGIQKTLTESNNVITFSPDKAGLFRIACSMNMYTGEFTVE